MSDILEQIEIAESLFFEGNAIPLSAVSGEDKQILEDLYSNQSKVTFSSSFRTSMYALFFSFKVKKSRLRQREFYFIKLKRLMAVADILMGFEARTSSIKIYEKCFSIAQVHGFDWAMLRCSRNLSIHYSIFTRDHRKSRKYSLAFKDCKDKYDNELQGESLYIELAQDLSRTKAYTQRIKEKAANAFEIMRSIPEDKKSILFNRYYLVIATAFHEINNEISELVDFLKLEIEKLKKSPYNLTTDLNVGYKILCHHALRVERYDVFNKAYSEGLTYVKRQTESWFRYQELKSLYLIRTGDFVDAQAMLIKLKKQKLFKNIHKAIRLRIDLKLLYSTVFLLFRNLDVNKNSKLVKQNMDLIINTPEYSQDKRAMNISLIILQLLVYIWKKDFDSLNEKFEALDKYLRRYTRSSPMFRSHAFVRVLLSLRRYGFVVRGAERTYRKYYKQLESVSFVESAHPAELEIIYYEDLINAIETYLGDVKPK